MTTLEQFPKTRDTLLRGIRQGMHFGAVIHVNRGNGVVLNDAIGFSGPGPGRRPLSPDNLLLWLSAGKPLTAIAVGILAGQGRVRWDDPVSRFIPEFDSHGKAGVLVRHLLTQTASYSPPRIDWPRIPREEVIRAICEADMPPDRKPGEYAAYDPQTTWYLLSEIIARMTGMPGHEFAAREILEPLGCRDTAGIGMPADQWTRLHESGHLVRLMETSRSASDKQDLEEEQPEREILAHPWPGDDAVRASAHNPGGGAWGRARDLGAVYRMMLNGGIAAPGSGPRKRILDAEIVREMTSRQRLGMIDHTFRRKIDWGFGFLINSARYGEIPVPYGYGNRASENTFGHGGIQSTSAYADPEADLCVVIIFNGLPGEAKHSRRVDEVNSALYEDLGI